MGRLLKFLITLIIGVALFGLIIEMVGLDRLLEAIFFFLSFKGLIVFILTLGSVYFGLLKWRFVLRRITGRREFKDLLKIWFSAFATTYILTPFAALGGEPIKFYLAKRNYNLDWRTSIASVAIERFLDWTVFLIFTIIGVFALITHSVFSPGRFVLFSVLLVLGLFSLLAVFYTKALKRESILEWIFKSLGIKKERFNGFSGNGGNIIFELEKEIIDFLSLKKSDFWKGLGLSFVRYFFFLFRAGFILFFLTGNISFIQSLAIYGFSNLAFIFPTPAAIGSLEAAGALSFKSLGLNAGGGAVFAMVSRGADLLVALIGLIFLIRFTIKLTGSRILGFFEKLKEQNNKDGESTAVKNFF